MICYTLRSSTVPLLGSFYDAWLLYKRYGCIHNICVNYYNCCVQQTYSGAIANSGTPPSLSDFKKILSEIIPHAEKYPSKAFGNGYLMSSIEGKGIQWMAMPCKVISDTRILGVSRGDQLDISSFKKVMHVIIVNLFVGRLYVPTRRLASKPHPSIPRLNILKGVACRRFNQ